MMASLVIAICFALALGLAAMAFVQAVEAAYRLRKLDDGDL